MPDQVPVGVKQEGYRYHVQGVMLIRVLAEQVWTQVLKPPKKPKAKKGQVAPVVDQAPDPNAGLRTMVSELNGVFTTSVQSFLTTLPSEVCYTLVYTQGAICRCCQLSCLSWTLLGAQNEIFV
jgi:hypothetical protein